MVDLPVAEGPFNRTRRAIRTTLRAVTELSLVRVGSPGQDDVVVALRTVQPHRATVADAGGSERSARLTWHADARRFTLTHWAGLVCVAQVEISPADASELLAVLAEGIADVMPTWLTSDPPPEPSFMSTNQPRSGADLDT